MSTSPALTPLDCVLDPSMAPKPPPFVDDQGQATYTIDAIRPSFQAFCGRADDGVVSNGIMVYPPACADMDVVEIDVPPLPDKIQMRSFYRVRSIPCPDESCSCQPDPDKYTFTPEEGRRLRMFAEQVCSPHDQYPGRANDFREAAFELAKMIHAKHQANREIARILAPVKP